MTGIEAKPAARGTKRETVAHGSFSTDSAGVVGRLMSAVRGNFFSNLAQGFRRLVRLTLWMPRNLLAQRLMGRTTMVVTTRMRLRSWTGLAEGPGNGPDCLAQSCRPLG